MSNEKFAQGDWVVIDNGYYLEIRRGYDQIGDVCSSGYAFDDGECTKGETTTANANLIAAAPDMYRALQEFTANSSCQTEFPNACEKAEQALAKARGES